MPTKSLPKYRQISQDLKKAIRTSAIDTGGSLPSHSELMSRYSASLSTIRQAINQLASEGWVRPEHGKGVFVERLVGGQPVLRKKKDSSTVGFAVFGEFEETNPVHQLFLEGAAEQLRQTDRDIAYGVFRPGPQQQEQFARFLERVSAVLISKDIPPQTVETLAAGQVRTVVVGHMPSQELDCEQFHNVYADMDGAGYLAAQTLAIHGHQKVAFVAKLPLAHPASQAVYQGMQLACNQYGIVDGGEYYVETSAEHLTLARRLADDKELTGLLVMGDHGGIMMAQAFMASGVSVPQDKSIISIGGLPREMLIGWDIPMTRVNVNYRLMAQEAARLLVTESRAAIHKPVPATLEKGQTITMLDSSGVSPDNK